MKSMYKLSAILFVVIFTSCAAPKDTSVWVNKEKIQGKTFSNIFIIVMTADIQARVRIEGDLANVAISRGLKAVKSSEVMPVDLNNPKMPTKEELVGKIKASGCDGVFVASLLKDEESVKFTAASTAYTQLPVYTFTGNYWGYYSNWYPTVNTASYYTHDKTYFMQSNLFDVASEEIMWSVKSEVFTPSSLEKFSSSYTKSLMAKLKSQKLIKE